MYGRDAQALRVFISSRMNNTLDAERRAAVETVNRFPHRSSWLWEDDAPAGVYHSERECTGIAGSSDELILILGQDLSAITRAEYEAAKKGGAQRYVMIRGTDVQDPDVKSSIAVARTGTVTRNFNNVGELRSHLYTSLNAATVRASREQSITRRRQVSFGPVQS